MTVNCVWFIFSTSKGEIIFLWYAFFVILCLHEVCKLECLQLFCFNIWFSSLKNLKCKLIWNLSKVMITEIGEGSYSINNKDLYSNFSGNISLVLICPSWFWLAKQFFGKKKSNLSYKESCSVFMLNLYHCLNLQFTFSFASIYLVFSWAMSQSHCSFCLGFSSQRTSLHCTIIKATLYTTSGQEMWVCLCTHKNRYVCQVVP